MPDLPEIYPMTMFPTLSVSDVGASVEWYTAKAGFTSVFCLPAPGGAIAMAHLRWRKHADVLLIPDSCPPSTARTKGVGVTISFLVRDTSIDSLAADLDARGVRIAEGPIDRPWNTRDIVVHDPDGYTLVFFLPLDTSRSFESMMGDLAQDNASNARPREDTPRPKHGN